MLFRPFLFTCVLALLLLSCQDGSKVSSVDGYLSTDASEVQMEAPRTAEPPPPPGEALPQRPANQKIIYTASASARVNDLDSALQQVTLAVGRAGGFVANQHRENSRHRRAVNLTLRLPADRLQPTLALLPRIAAQIDFENLDSRDVTAEWLDLESRLQTKRAVRDRYIEVLRKRAQKVEDILAAEDKIRVITEEIEARESRLRHLRDQVTLSTFSLELYETIEYRNPEPKVTYTFWKRLGDSFTDSFEIVEGFVLGIVTLWPVLLLGLVGFWLFRRWWRGRE